MPTSLKNLLPTIAGILALVASACVQAANPQGSLTLTAATHGRHQVLRVEGKVPRDGAALLAHALDQYPHLKRLELNSVGGSYLAGMAMGQLVRERGLHTAVEARDTCQSACVYVLAGGTQRRVDSQASVGIHSHSDASWGEHFNLPAPDAQGFYHLSNNGIAYVVGNSFLMVREGGRHLRSMGVGPEVMETILATPGHGNRMCFLAHACSVRWKLDNQSRLNRQEKSQSCDLGKSLLTDKGLQTTFQAGKFTGDFPAACTVLSR